MAPFFVLFLISWSALKHDAIQCYFTLTTVEECLHRSDSFPHSAYYYVTFLNLYWYFLFMMT